MKLLKYQKGLTVFEFLSKDSKGILSTIMFCFICSCFNESALKDRNNNIMNGHLAKQTSTKTYNADFLLLNPEKNSEVGPKNMTLICHRLSWDFKVKTSSETPLNDMFLWTNIFTFKKILRHTIVEKKETT